MKKNTIFIYIGIGLIAVLIIFFGGKTVVSKLSSSFGTKLKETTTSVATISQATLSVSAFSWDSTGGNKGNTAVLLYYPMLNIYTNKDIKTFEIKNVKLTNKIEGKHFITWPKDFKQMQDTNYYYEPTNTPQAFDKRNDEGRNFKFKVVDNPVNTNEIGKTGGVVDFRYTVWDLGNQFSYDDILNTTGKYTSGSALSYAGFKQGEINSPIEFDVVITYTDNSKGIKHFSLTTNFDEIYNQGYSFINNQNDYIGKTF